VDIMNAAIPAWSDLRHFLPEVILCGTFLLAILGDLVVRGRRPVVPFLLSLAGAVVALAYAVTDVPRTPHTILGSLVVVDGMAAFFRILFIFVALVTLLFSWASEEIMGRRRENKGEFYGLVVLLTAGMAIMAEARDILMLYLSLEMVGLGSYVLAGYMRRSLRSTEASLKYVIFGAVSSGVMLYGLSLLYGLTGSTTFDQIRDALQAGNAAPFSLLVITVLVLVGMGYKIAMVPFHFWCPDVYEGAPTPVTAFFSVGPKAAGFALMIRFFYTVYLAGPGAASAAGLLQRVDWPLLIALLSVVTMTYGNVVALRQSNVKRLLAYSSIAHVGYLLMGFLLLTAAGLQAILFYLLVYALMNLGAFLFVLAVNNRLRSEELADYAGLGFRAPWAAAMMTLFLFSLTGLPPTAGFIGKFYLFAEVMHQEYYWLAVVGVLNSVVSLFYYMKIVKAMYFTKYEGDEAAGRLRLAPLHMIVLVLLAVPTLVLGLYWPYFKGMADQAIVHFGGL
jgi:NADH-quinone oxidoreductase subunit N